MISGIILASGFSRRMAEEKLLLPFGGLPLIEHVIIAAQASRLDEVLLVYRDERIKEIGMKYRLSAVYNDRAEEGQSAAVKLGVKAARAETDAFMFLVADQPFLTAAVINILIEAHQEYPRQIVVSFYGAKRGNPVIFPADFKKDLLSLSGDSGGRSIIEENRDRVKTVAIADIRAGTDIDTKEDYLSRTPKKLNR